MLNLTIASPEQSFFSGEVTRVVLPGEMGEFEVLPHHMPFMSLLKSGSIIAYPKKEGIAFYIEAGIAQINKNHISVLVDTAFQARLKDQEKLLLEQANHRKQLSQQSKMDYTALLTKLTQLSSEINAIKRIRRHKK
jgi:F-type H+-transporting ATPase subunit epsilon